MQNAEGKWSDIFKLNCRTKLDADYIWKTSFRSIDDFPIIKTLPKFYQEVLLAFNKAKYIKPFYILNKHEVMEQPIWGSEYFKKQHSCIYIRGWIKADILYIKDIV